METLIVFGLLFLLGSLYLIMAVYGFIIDTATGIKEWIEWLAGKQGD